MRLSCGIDEAGRGPLAGPIVAAGVVAPIDFDWAETGWRDSKKFTERGRERWALAFKDWALEKGFIFEYEVIEVPDINLYNIGWANREVFRRLVLKLEADEYIVDGNHKLTDLGDKQSRTQSVIRADGRFGIVGAASILAKTYRDQIMRDLHEQYPQYAWDHNKGYGTYQHIMAIKKYGRTIHHRGKFASTVEAKTYTDPKAKKAEAKSESGESPA